MTKDEIIHMAREAGFCGNGSLALDGFESFLERFAALVAAHEREKQAEQEPAAFVYEKHIDGFGTRKDVAFLKRVVVGTKLYAAPAMTKDLTDDEITAMACETYGDTSVPEVEQIRIDFARAVIAADRELNK